MVKMAWKKINLKFTLLVIIKIFFVSEVFSEDKFIDGIKLRYTQPNTKIDIDIHLMIVNHLLSIMILLIRLRLKLLIGLIIC